MEAGEILPDEVHLPGVFVHRVIQATVNEKRIEQLTETDPSAENAKPPITGGRGRIVKRAAKEFKDGMYVNLGIGIPTMASNYLPDGVSIELQSENGLMGMGPFPVKGDADADWINAGKQTVTPVKGASIFSSSDSFGMIRSCKVGLTILGGMQVRRATQRHARREQRSSEQSYFSSLASVASTLANLSSRAFLLCSPIPPSNPSNITPSLVQVSVNGDLANWIIPGKMVKGMGGAMDLVGAPGSKVVVTMEHVAKNGGKKILNACSLPLTGKGVVDLIITDMCVFECDKINGGLTLIEMAEGLTVDDIKENTECDFKVADVLGVMEN